MRPSHEYIFKRLMIIAFCILVMERSEDPCVLNWDGFLAASADCTHIQKLGATFQENTQDLSTALAAWRC